MILNVVWVNSIIKSVKILFLLGYIVLYNLYYLFKFVWLIWYFIGMYISELFMRCYFVLNDNKISKYVFYMKLCKFIINV